MAELKTEKREKKKEIEKSPDVSFKYMQAFSLISNWNESRVFVACEDGNLILERKTNLFAQISLPNKKQKTNKKPPKVFSNRHTS